jgi:hypothetical protein
MGVHSLWNFLREPVNVTVTVTATPTATASVPCKLQDTKQGGAVQPWIRGCISHAHARAHTHTHPVYVSTYLPYEFMR